MPLTERKAADEYRAIANSALSCITQQRLFWRDRPAGNLTLQLQTRSVRVWRTSRARERSRIYLEAAVRVRAVRVGGTWQAEPEHYIYRLVPYRAHTGGDRDDDNDILSFHLHPESLPWPHVHVGGSSLLAHKAHVPTGIVTLAEVVRLLVADSDFRVPVLAHRQTAYREILGLPSEEDGG